MLKSVFSKTFKYVFRCSKKDLKITQTIIIGKGRFFSGSRTLVSGKHLTDSSELRTTVARAGLELLSVRLFENNFVGSKLDKHCQTAQF